MSITRKRFLQALVGIAGFLKLPLPARATSLIVDDTPIDPCLVVEAERILRQYSGHSIEFECDAMVGMEVGQDLKWFQNGVEYGADSQLRIKRIETLADSRLRVTAEDF